mmetsp:Transcript_70979/g.170011  ORF Transcript_70979/g.170011 Transcript_70979/m.170011 type:complete len:1085 (-) Transcript_70979:94-3348(-)
MQAKPWTLLLSTIFYAHAAAASGVCRTEIENAVCEFYPLAEDEPSGRALLAVNTLRARQVNSTLVLLHDPAEEVDAAAKPQNVTEALPATSLLQAPGEYQACLLAAVVFGVAAMATTSMHPPSAKEPLREQAAKEDSDLAPASILLDNAKVLVQILVILADVLRPCLSASVPQSMAVTSTFNDCSAWLYGGEGLVAKAFHAAVSLSVPLVCFLGGVCSQGPVTPERVRRFIRTLIVPTALWVFIFKPTLVASLSVTTSQELLDSMSKILTLQAVSPEWFLQALVIWRGSAFVLWSHFRPVVALALMMLASATAGYTNFSGAASAFCMNEVFGFLPYFAIGFVFPYASVCTCMSELSSVRLLAACAMVVYWTQVLMPMVFPLTLPSGHDVYGGPSLQLDGWSYHVYWVQRLARVATEVPPMLAVLFFILPRWRTSLTWIGPHTLYPFLLYPFAHALRDRALATMSIPKVDDPVTHVTVLLLQVIYAISVVSILASRPVRTVFSCILKPQWLESLWGEIPASTPATQVSSTRQHGPLATPGIAADSEASTQEPSSPKEPTLKRRNWPVRSFGYWNGSMPTWKQSEPITRMSEARKYYPYLIPAFLAILLPSLLIGTYTMQWLLLRAQFSVPLPMLISTFVMLLLPTPITYICNFYRLKGAEALPRQAPSGPFARKPLQHVVVVVAYKEPLEVVKRTMESVVAQVGTFQPPIVVFATEARDATRKEMFQCVKEICDRTSHRLLLTEHVLQEDETIGKSSNENWAVRQVYEQLVENEKKDPFEIMISIVDSDSVMSTTYLAHVEASFQKQPDGRRCIYSGPLNTYRNIAEANLLVAYYEVTRVHNDTFCSLFDDYVPQSNYSLTLGLAAEVDFWTPDNMPEDLHTAYKVFLLNQSLSTVAIKPIICNDLVEGFSDRYVQAKRHVWGITQICWILAIRDRMKIGFREWLKLAWVECKRPGSLVQFALRIGGYVQFVVIASLVAMNWQVLADRLKLYMLLLSIAYVWRCVWFWVVELLYWKSQWMREFKVETLGPCAWALLVLLSPILHVAVTVVFEFIPCIDCLIHATFVGELAYVCAPKGTGDKKTTT